MRNGHGVLPVGSKQFVGQMQEVLEARGQNRNLYEEAGVYELRELATPYRVNFTHKNDALSLKNKRFWNLTPAKSNG